MCRSKRIRKHMDTVVCNRYALIANSMCIPYQSLKPGYDRVGDGTKSGTNYRTRRLMVIGSDRAWRAPLKKSLGMCNSMYPLPIVRDPSCSVQAWPTYVINL